MVLNCSRHTLQAILMFLSASMILFFPSLTMILLRQSSFTLGIVVASLCTSFFLSIYFYLHRTLKFDQSVIFVLFTILSCYCFIVFHLFLVNQQLPMLIEVDAKRFFFSFVCLFIVVLSAFLIALYLKSISNAKLFFDVVNVCGVLLLLNGLISLTKIDFFSTGLSKPTFLFLEPSHFALVVTPFLIFFCLTLSRNKAILLLFVVASWIIDEQHCKTIESFRASLLEWLNGSLLQAFTFLRNFFKLLKSFPISGRTSSILKNFWNS